MEEVFRSLRKLSPTWTATLESCQQKWHLNLETPPTSQVQICSREEQTPTREEQIPARRKSTTTETKHEKIFPHLKSTNFLHFNSIEEKGTILMGLFFSFPFQAPAAIGHITRNRHNLKNRSAFIEKAKLIKFLWKGKVRWDRM